MTRPVVLQLRAFPEADQAALERDYDMLRLHAAADPDAVLSARGGAVRAIATRGGVGAPGAVIRACPACELIAVYGVGYDAVDLDAARAQGIAVTHTPDVLTGDVADLAVALMLAHRRDLAGAEAWVRSGDWAARGAYPLRRRAWGGRAGILGMGRIGRAVARRLAGFETTLAYHDLGPVPDAPGRFEPDLVALARDADVLFVAAAATAATRGLVGRAVLDALGPEGLLVNVARAAIVDEPALIAALAEGRLGGAALDVMAGEPAPSPALLAAPNLLLQPHHASATHDTRAAMGRLMRENLAAHFAGRPLPTPIPEMETTP